MSKIRCGLLCLLLAAGFGSVHGASGYTTMPIAPAPSGCPVTETQNFLAGASLPRQWSVVLPYPPTILTVSPNGSSDQLTEIQETILPSYGAWAGVSGTLLNASWHPGALGPLGQTTTQIACTDDTMDNIDGISTICFDQPSTEFTTGVLAITEIIAADAPGVMAGSAGPSVFAGQILDADILFRPDGQATFATPGELGMPGAQSAYDLESILIHEIGGVLGLGNSGIWRAAMFPYAPPPGTFLGNRPTNQQPDAPLADDDRAGLRTLYDDGSDATDIGIISGHVLPANPFELAVLSPSSEGEGVTGVMSAQVIAVDAATGEVIAGTLGGWNCSPAIGVPVFDGFYAIQHLPLGRNYNVYAEPLSGALAPSEFGSTTAGVCTMEGTNICTPPPAQTNFSATFHPPAP